MTAATTGTARRNRHRRRDGIDDGCRRDEENYALNGGKSHDGIDDYGQLDDAMIQHHTRLSVRSELLLKVPCVSYAQVCTNPGPPLAPSAIEAE